MSRAIAGVVVAALLGCARFPTTNSVVAKAISPNGQSTAVLVDRYYHAARSSDEFFVVVTPSRENIEQLIKARSLGASAVLVATWASKIQLRWQDNDTLEVICASCGLKPIDISKKLPQVGSIRIVYVGFPDHTAYS